MYSIATLNKISPKGLALLSGDYQLTEDVAAASGILVRSQDMHSMELSASLMAVARAGAGVNNIPLEVCADKGIVVFNTPGANANAVKELVLAGMFLAARHVPAALNWAASLSEDVSAAVEKGKSQFAGTEILGKALGVLGLGAIGRKVADAAAALDMKVCGYDPYYAGGADSAEIFDSLDELLPLCDYVTVHIPATDSTKGMLNKELFAKMKKGAVLLNFSRDKLVKDEDLLEALAADTLSAYVTDFPNDALAQAAKAQGEDGDKTAKKIILLPHLGASTEEAEENCAMMAVNQIRDYFENGNIVNSVNYPALTMGPRTGKVRVGLLTKGCADPKSLLAELLAAKGIASASIEGAAKGDYGYALADTSLTDASAVPELTSGSEAAVRQLVFA